MEACYEYLGCKKTECVMFKMPPGTKCWEVEGTLCSNDCLEAVERGAFATDKRKCKYCIYYKTMALQEIL